MINAMRLIPSLTLNKEFKMMNQLAKISAVVSVALSSAGYAGHKPNEQERDIYEFIAAQGTFCADLFGNGECMLLNAPLNNIFSWSDPATYRMGYFDYSGVADRAFNGRFGTHFNGEVIETEMEDGRGLVSVKLHTQNAIAWAYIRDPYNPFSQPEEQLFGHWINPGYSVNDGFVRGESIYNVNFVIPEFGGPMPDLIQWAYMPPTGAEIREILFKGCAFDANTNMALVVHQETDDNWESSVEDVLIVDVSNRKPVPRVKYPKKSHENVCKKYLKISNSKVHLDLELKNRGVNEGFHPKF